MINCLIIKNISVKVLRKTETNRKVFAVRKGSLQKLNSGGSANQKRREYFNLKKENSQVLRKIINIK